MVWKRKLGIGCGIVTLIVVAAAGAIFYLQPWVPRIQVADAGPTGRRVNDAGLIANYYPGRGEGPRPALLLIGGSEGGIGESTRRTALALQAEGFSVLNLSYYRAPGQPPDLEMVPLETFSTALFWLRRQKEVDPKRIGMVGASKGAEAALLVATRNAEIRAVVAGMPSSVAWQGFSWERRGEFGSSWSERGLPVAYLPFGGWKWTSDISAIYGDALRNLTQYPAAVIPVERSSAPVLLVCGHADALWPSCPMALQVQRRARERSGPPVTVLAYADAGHAVFGRPLQPSEKGYSRLSSLGGTAEGNNRARQDSWPRVIAFLRASLGR